VKTSQLLLILLVVNLLVAISLVPAETNSLPAIEVTTDGLKSVRYQGAEFLARGSFEINSVCFESAAGKVSPGSTKHLTSVNPNAKSEKLIFDWGTITVQYLAKPDKFVLDITTSNQTNSVLRTLSYDALALRLAYPPAEYNGVVPMLATNIGAPSVIPLTYGHHAVVLCNEDVRRPLLVGFPWALDKPANTVFPLRINTGRDSMYPDSLPTIDRPISPGATDRFTLSFRFGAAPIDLARVASDLFGMFAKVNPFTLKWPDRRPIGSLIVATSAAGWPKNPRGWLLDPNLDITTSGGLAAFHARLLDWADQSVRILESMNAQGMVTWDVEGEQFPHPTTYIGDPRLVGALAPEMQNVIDEYFARFTRAGLRVGVTIRPQTVTLLDGGRRVEQTSSDDPAQILIDKIAYARKRWGATLFYIDSNGDPNLPLSFEVIRRVADSYPDVLLMPEHKNAAYYSETAPYAELRGGISSTPEFVRGIYPGAFSVINTADGPIDQEYAELQKAVARGDILMFRAWFADPANEKVKNLTAVPSRH
jgi:hypothetical protein